MRKSEIAAELFDAFLALNRRLIGMAEKYKSSLSLAESHLLGEIAHQQQTRAISLIKILNFEKTQVSRIIKSFLDKKFISQTKSDSDHRIKYFSISPLGAEALEHDNLIRNQQIEHCFDGLTKPEKNKLAESFKTFADGLQIDQLIQFTNDSPLKLQTKRVARALGFVDNSLLQLDQDSHIVQALHIIHREGDALSLATLKSLLPYENSGISRLTSQLVRENFARKSPLVFDSRHTQISLTSKGEDYAKKHIKLGRSFLLKCLHTQSFTQIDALVSLIRKTTDPSAILTSAIGDLRYDIFIADDEELRNLSRTFLVEHLVKTNQHKKIGEKIISKDNVIAVAKQVERIIGICELQATPTGWIVKYLESAKEINQGKLNYDLLSAAAKIAFSKKTLKRVEVPSEYLTLLKAKKRKDLSGRDAGRTYLEPKDL